MILVIPGRARSERTRNPELNALCLPPLDSGLAAFGRAPE